MKLRDGLGVKKKRQRHCERKNDELVARLHLCPWIHVPRDCKAVGG